MPDEDSGLSQSVSNNKAILSVVSWKPQDELEISSQAQASRNEIPPPYLLQWQWKPSCKPELLSPPGSKKAADLFPLPEESQSKPAKRHK